MIAERNGVVYFGEQPLSPDDAEAQGNAMKSEWDPKALAAVDALNAAKAALDLATATLQAAQINQEIGQQLVIAARQARLRLGQG